jgi:hypothetical protein
MGFNRFIVENALLSITKISEKAYFRGILSKMGFNRFIVEKCISERYKNIRESLFSRNSVKNGIRQVHSGKCNSERNRKISEKAYLRGILSKMGFDWSIVESAFLRVTGKYQRNLIFEEFCQKWDSTGS